MSECVWDGKIKQTFTNIRSEPQNILEDQSFLSDEYDFLIQLTVFFGFQYLHLILRWMKLENSVRQGWNNVSVFEFFKQN